MVLFDVALIQDLTFADTESGRNQDVFRYCIYDMLRPFMIIIAAMRDHDFHQYCIYKKS